MQRLIEKDARNAERIRPFIGGEEINESPTHCHYRYIIGFGEMTEEEARRWPDLMKIVEERVKPQRMGLRDSAAAKSRKEKWWLWSRPTTELYNALQGKDRRVGAP